MALGEPDGAAGEDDVALDAVGEGASCSHPAGADKNRDKEQAGEGDQRLHAFNCRMALHPMRGLCGRELYIGYFNLKIVRNWIFQAFTSVDSL